MGKRGMQSTTRSCACYDQLALFIVAPAAVSGSEAAPASLGRTRQPSDPAVREKLTGYPAVRGEAGLNGLRLGQERLVFYREDLKG